MKQNPEDRDELVVPHGDKVMIVHRNREAENAVYCRNCKACIQILFINEDTASLALKGTDVLKNNWFFFLWMR